VLTGSDLGNLGTSYEQLSWLFNWKHFYFVGLK